MEQKTTTRKVLTRIELDIGGRVRAVADQCATNLAPLSFGEITDRFTAPETSKNRPTGLFVGMLVVLGRAREQDRMVGTT